MDRLPLAAHIELVDAVVHLAAQSMVKDAKEAPYAAWNLNVLGTLNVLEACRLSNKMVIVPSSNHVYGTQPPGPVAEDANLTQLDTYSASKIAVDYMTRSYAHNYGTKTMVIRNTNCFSADDPHLEHLIPGTICSILRDESPVIHSDGTRVKSYLYVDDVAMAYVRGLDYLNDGGTPGMAFNVSGERDSVEGVVRRICSIMAWTGGYTMEGIADDEPDEHLNYRAFQKATGWAPSFSLDQGIRKTIEGLRVRLAVPV